MESSPQETANDTLSRFASLIRERNLDDLMKQFHEDCYWRDLVAYTWNIKSFEGREQILGMLRTQLQWVEPRKMGNRQRSAGQKRRWNFNRMV